MLLTVDVRIGLDVAETLYSICASGHGAKLCGEVTIGSRYRVRFPAPSGW